MNENWRINVVTASYDSVVIGDRLGVGITNSHAKCFSSVMNTFKTHSLSFKLFLVAHEISWPTVLTYYSVSLKKLLKFSTEMCFVQVDIFFLFKLICIIPYIYPRESTIKYIHFNFAALHDGCLWFLWSVTHHLFAVSVRNFMSCTNDFLHGCCPHL